MRKQTERSRKALANSQGLTLEVIVKQEADSRLVVDFGSEVTTSIIAQNGKELLIEVLSDAGLMMDDLDGWNGRADGSR